MPETISSDVKQITPNTRFSVQLVGFALIVASVWGAGFGASSAVNAARNQAEQDKRDIAGQIRDLREELSRGQNALTIQISGGWTFDNQRRWAKQLQKGNPAISVPDPDDVRSP